MSKKKAVKVSNLVERSSTIYRHSAPTVYDHADQGTQCVVALKELYVQTCPDEGNPCWVLRGPWIPTPQAVKPKE